MLLQSEKLASLGKVAAGVAHEIRNPLTAIKMLIFTLQNELAPRAKFKNDFKIILKEIERMERFLQNFLDFARPPDPNFDIISAFGLLYQPIESDRRPDECSIIN